MKYRKMKARLYNESPVVDIDTGKYFLDRDDINEHCEQYGVKPEELRLVFCEPEYFHEIDPNDIYRDILPDGLNIDDVSLELSEAFHKLNKVIKTKIVANWFEGDTKVIWSK